MTSLPQITWLRTFEAAARHGSFSAAARELGQTPAAVSQQVRLLERHLDVALFERLPRGVALTEIGKAYAQPIRKSFLDMQHATSGLFSASHRRVVRVRASISCAALVIAPNLAAFHALHPDIDVHLSTFVWADRFGAEESDIDIRFGYGDWKDGRVTHLGHEFAVPVCHPAHAARFGDDLTLQALTEGQVVLIVGSESDWLRLSEFYDLHLNHIAATFRADSSLLALQVVAAGEGVALVLERFAQGHLAQGLLTAPFDYRLPVRPSHFVVERDGANRRDEVQTFTNWVVSLYQA